MGWFKKKQICVHCERNRTRRNFEDQPTCPDCQVRILMEREVRRTCPEDGATLNKVAQGAIIVDECPKCKGVWLDAGELEAIKQAANQEGMGAGMVLGMST